ncbi:PREDICTED: uncharacterized protein LOC108751551 [Trachymyrmex septentrionalis]|uniref:uncharacterized protein LOC108751551 n=1 Tax=Trachymyrmex septentrionalis TaxID=34720 RepID=UPI00084F4B85|nr:PREDICTED: uncharacterized protein LOC108751551 [Trachymyrmex septentrionalis]
MVTVEGIMNDVSNNSITSVRLAQQTGTNNNQKVSDLENMVGVAVYPIQAVKAFGELPNLYEISGLHAVVVCLLLGAVVLVVGLVQLVPGATTTNHRLALLVAGAALLILGFILAGVRCYVLHCVPLPVESPIATPIPPTGEQAPVVPKGTLDLLVGHQNQPETDALMQHREHHHHHQHHSYHHHNNHKKKRSSQGSHSEEA